MGIKNIKKNKMKYDGEFCLSMIAKYMERLDKSIWDIERVRKRIHMSKWTYEHLIKNKENIIQQELILEHLVKLYEALRKGTINKIERIKSIGDSVNNKNRTRKSTHILYPLYFDPDKDVNSFWVDENIRYIICEKVSTLEEFKKFFEELCDLGYMSYINEFCSCDKLNIDQWIEHFDYWYLGNIYHQGDANPYHQARPIELVVLGYMLGINSRFLEGRDTNISLFEGITGNNFRIEHIRMKTLWLYDNGYINCKDNDMKILVLKLIEECILTPEERTMFCDKFNINYEALSGKYQPLINNNKDTMFTSIELKEQMKYYDHFYKE